MATVDPGSQRRVGLVSQVSLQACPTYEWTRVNGAVSECLARLPAARTLLRPGARVIVKPNLINARPPETAICTHPAVVRAVAQWACAAGCEVTIADEPGYALLAKAEPLFARAGIAQACEDLPVRYELLRMGGYVVASVPSPLRLAEVRVSAMLREADVVINVPKCKTHGQTLFTGAVKNLFGGVAPRQRIQIHSVGGFEGLSEAVVDAFACQKPQLTVMDAIVAMEGNGPTRGKPRPLGLVAASGDAVALDAVMEHLAGYEPGEVRATAAAGRQGLGECLLTRIQVDGHDIRRARVTFERPPGLIRHAMPRWVGRLVTRHLWVRPTFDPARCVACTACAAVCPGGAIEVSGRAKVDYDRCLECFCCQEVCPVDAIDSRESLLARVVVGSSRRVMARRPTRPSG